MSNLQKFNQTLEDFNQEVEQLKDVSGAFKKLQQLTETYNTIIKQFEENSKTLGEINELQKAQQEKVAQSLIELENVNKQHKTELAKLVEEKTDQIRKENKDFYENLESTIKIKLDKINELQKAQQESFAKNLTEIENANKQHKTELAKLVEEKTDQIRKENKDFYKDLESTVKIKLDDNKSEIKKTN